MIDVFSPETLAALVGSFAVSFLVLLTQRWHGRLTGDHDLQGIQKIHQAPVPRVGGLGVAVGLIAATITATSIGSRTSLTMLLLLVCAAPCFAAGLLEDLTKTISVRARLIASFVGAALAAWMLDASLERLDTRYLDTLMAFTPFSILFTCFAVGGMTNAVNIIDGLNGLAAGCVAIMLAGLAVIAWRVGDPLVLNLCLWGIAALAGFLILNFPFGRIFLGDGGAYLAGFWVAECGVLLLARNPSVSTWAVLLCCIYPVWETVFSVYRRQIRQGVNSGQPDRTHLHHLIYSHVERGLRSKPRNGWKTHGSASALIWCVVAVCASIATVAFNDTSMMVVVVIVFCLIYSMAYRFLLSKDSEAPPRTAGPALNL